MWPTPVDAFLLSPHVSEHSWGTSALLETFSWSPLQHCLLLLHLICSLLPSLSMVVRFLLLSWAIFFHSAPFLQVFRSLSRPPIPFMYIYIYIFHLYIYIPFIYSTHIYIPFIYSTYIYISLIYINIIPSLIYLAQISFLNSRLSLHLAS